MLGHELAQCAVCNMQCAICNMHYAMCNTQCAIFNVQCAIYAAWPRNGLGGQALASLSQHIMLKAPRLGAKIYPQAKVKSSRWPPMNGSPISAPAIPS